MSGTLHPLHAGYFSSGPCRACTVRLLPGTLHPVLTGYFVIRLRCQVLSIRLHAGYSSSGPCRVLLIRSMPGTLPSDPCRVRTSHPEGPKSQHIMPGRPLPPPSIFCVYRSDTSLLQNARKTMLGHNRVYGSTHTVKTGNTNRKESAHDVYVENPKWEKPRESSNSNYHYVETMYNKHTQRQRPLVRYLRHRRWLQWRQRPLSHSLSIHDYSLHSCTNKNGNTQKNEQQLIKVCPRSYLY